MEEDKNWIISKFGGLTPIKHTNSYQVYSTESTENLFLIYYILALDGYLESKSKEQALNELVAALHDPKNVVSNNFIDILKNQVGITLFDSANYERILGQMTLCRMVDNFTCYLKDLLVEVVIKEPNILKSKETEKLEDILSFESMNELREFIIEKKMRELFYKSIEEIKKFFNDKLGIDIFGDSFSDLNLFIKQRNVIVHNRALVNEELVKIHPYFEGNIGKQLLFSYDKLEQIFLFLNNLVVTIDTKVSNKFKLNTINNTLTGLGSK